MSALPNSTKIQTGKGQFYDFIFMDIDMPRMDDCLTKPLSHKAIQTKLCIWIHKIKERKNIAG